MTVYVPTVKKKCKKVFGKRWCVKVPWMSKEKFCFRIKQIISGLNLMGFIMDALMKSIKKVLPFLDIERQLIKLFPGLNSLPGVPSLSLPSLDLPDFDFPRLGFPGTCVDKLTQVTDGTPAIIAAVETCFDPPAASLPYPFVVCQEPPSWCSS